MSAKNLDQFPILGQIMGLVTKTRLRLAMCEKSCMLLDIACEPFISEAKVVGAATLNHTVLDAAPALCF